MSDVLATPKVTAGTFQPRTVRTSPHWLDADGAKLYTISADGSAVDHFAFADRLAAVKAARDISWRDTAHFAIFHKGASLLYLVLCWWGNDNELFTSVSVRTGEGWVEQPERYSFCLYDLEIFWDERNTYVATMYCARPDIDEYRRRRRSEWTAMTTGHSPMLKSVEPI
ncbi:MAG TPA: hypothetical protein VFB32_07215 [Rudaea sp.]|nr:hypothetical protein [Rudaea sp.]